MVRKMIWKNERIQRRGESPRKKLSPCREKVSPKKTIESLNNTKGKKDISDEGEGDQREKHQYIVSITKGIPDQRTHLKGQSKKGLST